MTDEQKQVYEQLFTRYGSPSREAELTVRDYLIKPDTIYDCDRLLRDDKEAQKTIEALENAIEKMNIYRLAIAEQYNKLQTAPVKKIVRLERKKDTYNNKVFYWLLTIDKYEDGHEEQTSSVKYLGTDRMKAINDFKQYQKEHPGISASMNIKKAAWER